MIVPAFRKILTSGSEKKPVAEPYRPVAMYVAVEPRQLFPPLPPWAYIITSKPLIRKKLASPFERCVVVHHEADISGIAVRNAHKPCS